MHVMRNLGKRKMPISRIFGVPASAGSFLAWLNRSAHSVLFIIFYCFICLTLTDISCVMCCRIGSIILAASLRLLYNVSCCVLWFTVCGCGWSFQLIFVWTWLSMFLPESSEDAPVWLLTAYIVNYKDLWQHPVKPDRAIGLFESSY